MRGSGIALLKPAHPPQHTAQHRNSTHLRAAWYLSYVAGEHVGIIDFLHTKSRMAPQRPLGGQSRRFGPVLATSAIHPSRPNIGHCPPHIRFASDGDRTATSLVRNVPEADIPGHSMTRSARNKASDGSERPSVFAAFMLSTVSNLTARSTGRSAGLTPRRILSTNKAASLHIS
jgi:hypothetical protein